MFAPSPNDDLLQLAANRLSDIVGDNLYPSPGDVTEAELAVHILDVPSRQLDPSRPESAPCIKLSPYAGTVQQDARDEIEEFAVQFVWYAVDEDGRPDHILGKNLIMIESRRIMRRFMNPFEIGNYRFRCSNKGTDRNRVLYGKTDGDYGGFFLPPYYNATYLLKAQYQFS